MTRCRCFCRLLVILSLLLPSLVACSQDGEGKVFYAPPATQGPASYNKEIFSSDADYLIVLGDIQEYTRTSANLSYLTYTMEWLRWQTMNGANIKALVCVGDITNDNKFKQWKVAKDNFNLISDIIPTLCVTGNHDYDWDRAGEAYTAISSRNTSHLSQYCDSELLESRLGAKFHPDSIDNVIMNLELGGREFSIAALEFGMRPEVADWAGEYIESHSDRRFIILTHELLTGAGKICQSLWTHSDEQFSVHGLPYLSPREVIDRLGKPYDNVVAMLCGHNGFSALNTETVNNAGATLPIVLFNLQYQPNGGDAMIELWEFPHDSREINVKILNTVSESILPPPLHPELLESEQYNPEATPTQFTLKL